MYNRITFNYDGITTKGILLAECDFIETISVPVEKKFLFFKYYSKGTDKRKFKMYIVFIPWKHAMKDIVFISERQILSVDGVDDDNWINIDSYISKFVKEEPYYCEYEIENFNGYKFIYDDNEFIANIRNGLKKYCLETLYNNLPSIIEEEFDEDTAIRDNPMFLTGKEREGQGTAFIELQYCKHNLPRLIALKKIRNWKNDSLYIDVPFALSIFLDQYFDIFKSVNKNLEDVYSPEYFTLKQVIELRERLLELKPIDYRILVQWLDVCIDKGYSMYFLGV